MGRWVGGGLGGGGDAMAETKHSLPASRPLPSTNSLSADTDPMASLPRENKRGVTADIDDMCFFSKSFVQIKLIIKKK